MDSKFKVYSDLLGWEAPGGGTIPPALCVTNLKPDIVIIDEHKKTLHIFELTMPLNRNIDDRNKEKTLKYTPFPTDIIGYNCTLNCFEISSTGFINTRNKTTLNTLHTFIKKSIQQINIHGQPQFIGMVWILQGVADSGGPWVRYPSLPGPSPGTLIVLTVLLEYVSPSLVKQVLSWANTGFAILTHYLDATAMSRSLFC